MLGAAIVHPDKKGVKPGDHKFLFEQVSQAKQEKRSVTFEIRENGVTHRFHFVNQVPLNEEI